MSKELLRIENLHAYFDTYEGTAKVLNGVDLKIDGSETQALVGETGCGKSLTVKTVLNLVPNARIPEGEIYFKGEKVYGSDIDRRDKIRGNEISIIMQDPMTSLNPVFTVGEQMVDIYRYQGNNRLSYIKYIKNCFRSKDDAKNKILQVLKDVQLSSPERVFESYPHQLSGGMRQRVLIAIALLSKPSLLIADEPGTALDVTTEDEIINLINGIVDEYNTGVLYITHDLGIAKQVSEYANIMYAGEIVEHGPTKEIFDFAYHPYTRGLIESMPSFSHDMNSGIEGTVPDFVDLDMGCRFADRCKYASQECIDNIPYSRIVDKNRDVKCHLFNGEPVNKNMNTIPKASVEINKPEWVKEQAPEVKQ